MSARPALIVVLFALVLVPARAADPLETSGKVDAVTVYRGQALVTRVVPLPPDGGLREVIVAGLPEHVVPGSLHAAGGPGVEIRSVRYRARPVEQDVREEVRRMDEQIRDLRDRLTAAERQAQLIAERRGYLDKLEQFTATTANVELSRGVLNSDTLEKLSEYMLAQRRAHLEEELNLVREQRTVKQQLETLERQRQTLTRDSARTQREAIVFVNAPAGPGELRLRYLVDKATWEPSYNIRADEARRGAVVEYNAAIQQMSGEDWPDVAMTLSTASPSLTAKAPELTALAIALVAPAQAEQQQAGGRENYGQKRRELVREQKAAEAHRQRNAPPAAAHNEAPYREHDAVLNRLAGEMQLLDLVALGRERAADPAVVSEGYSAVYRVESRTTLPSRADRQLIRIAALPLQGEFYKVAVPVLTEYVYDEADLVNDSPLVLLAGPVSTYVGGQFVGQSALPNVAAGERFTVGLGIDPGLRAARELVDKKESTQGGNRIVDFTYRLTIENFAAAPAALRVLDRLPTGHGQEIKVTLTEPGKGSHTDGPGAAADRKKGLLRWDAEVPPQAAGALAIEYQFRLEYDRQMALAGIAGQ